MHTRLRIPFLSSFQKQYCTIVMPHQHNWFCTMLHNSLVYTKKILEQNFPPIFTLWNRCCAF